MRGGAWRRRLSTAGFYALAAVFMLPTIFVFYWMLTLSLKPQIEATAYPPSFVRFTVTLAGYREVFTKYPFFLYTWNSLVVATGCTLLGLAVGLPAAYSIARWKQQRLAVVILVARIIPGIAYLIPWYIFFRSLRMVDTYGALILTHLIVGLPIIIWVMISFFEDVPSDLEDAALIDGCSQLSVFWRIALPLVKPGVLQIGGHVLEERDHDPDDDRQAHDQVREDQRAVGVDHPEVAKEDVPGDQVGDPGNDPRHQDDHRQPLLPPVSDGVGGGQPHRESEQRAARRHHQAVPCVEEERVLGEDFTIARGRDAEAHERGRIGRRLDLRLQRERDHPVENEDRRQHEEQRQPVEAGRREPAPSEALPAHHEALRRTLIRIRDAPMTSANSATAIEAA